MSRVFDNKGQELTVGARVERVGVLPNGQGPLGTVTGFGDCYMRVTWDLGISVLTGPRISFVKVERSTWLPWRRRFVCPDLQIIDSPSERKG